MAQLSKYNQSVIDHFNNPRNVGTFSAAENVSTSIVGAPACGDVLKLQIKVENNKIVDSKFKTFGCASAIAASSLTSEWLKGKNLLDALKISNKEIAKELSLPPVKLHCSLLAEEAVKKVVNNYMNSKRN